MENEQIKQILSDELTVNRRTNLDDLLVDAFRIGMREGVKIERQECLEAVDKLRAEAQAKLKVLNGGN